VPQCCEEAFLRLMIDVDYEEPHRLYELLLTWRSGRIHRR
jgi:hypothetical protein